MKVRIKNQLKEMGNMALTIKPKAFEQILCSIRNKEIYFDAEGGCACGRLEVQLNEQLYMSVYRSCRKSSSTPDNKWWHIDEFEFHNKPYALYDEDKDEDSDFQITNLYLSKEQAGELIELLKKLTTEDWGIEYR